jgi:hypothetical protein
LVNASLSSSNLPDSLHEQNQSSGKPDNSNVSDGDNSSSIQDTPRLRRLPVGSRPSAMLESEFSMGEPASCFGSLLDAVLSKEYLQCKDCGRYYINAQVHRQTYLICSCLVVHSSPPGAFPGVLICLPPAVLSNRPPRLCCRWCCSIADLVGSFEGQRHPLNVDGFPRSPAALLGRYVADGVLP